MRFEEAYQRARDTLMSNGKAEVSELIEYRAEQGHRFVFSGNGNIIEVIIDQNGDLSGLNHRGQLEKVPPPPSADRAYGKIDRARAQEIALAELGGGRVVDVDEKKDGFKVEVSKGMGRKTEVFVDLTGRAHVRKKQRFGDLMDFDL